MKTSAPTTNMRPILKWLKAAVSETTFFGLSFDALLFFIIIAILNAHLILGESCRSLVFIPERVFAGEWHRLVTYPFVHLTWYHFVLDAGAFFLLYTGLEERRIGRRILYVTGGGLTSLAAAWMFAPAIDKLGLCGLSGIAHGLMAVSALEMMGRQSTLRVGIGCLIVVTVKSIYEAAAGEVVFAFLHFGLCGTPLAVCHLGGVVGGLILFSGIKIYQIKTSKNTEFTLLKGKSKSKQGLNVRP